MGCSIHSFDSFYKLGTDFLALSAQWRYFIPGARFQNGRFPAETGGTMKRILVVGCCGAGKSVLSRELGKKLGLPVVHLDRLFWLPGWVERGPAKRSMRFSRRSFGATDGSWTGNFSRTFARRLESADAVIFLRYSRFCCLSGVFRRWIRYFGRSRPDLGEGCPEKIDLRFLRFVWNYNRVTLPKMEAQLAGRPGSCRLIELRSRREARQFLEKL